MQPKFPEASTPVSAQKTMSLPKQNLDTPLTPIEQLPENIKKELREISGLTEIGGLMMFARNESASDYDDIIELVLQKLPKEIADKKLAEYSSNRGITLLQAIEESFALTKKRNLLWNYGGNEKYYQEIKKSIEIFESAKYKTELFKGKGNAAYVFQTPEVPNVCIKFIHSPAMQRYTIDREFGILSSAYAVSSNFKKLKIPEPHAVAVHVDNTKSFFTMETIDGMTLLQLEDFPGDRKRFLERAGFSESYLMSLLSDTKTLELIQKDIELLHGNDILHGDIHPRNIMLDIHGNFYLIDFGNAVIPTNLPAGIDYETVENTKELDSRAFSTSFDITLKNLKKQSGFTN